MRSGAIGLRVPNPAAIEPRSPTSRSVEAGAPAFQVWCGLSAGGTVSKPPGKCNATARAWNALDFAPLMVLTPRRCGGRGDLRWGNPWVWAGSWGRQRSLRVAATPPRAAGPRATITMVVRGPRGGRRGRGHRYHDGRSGETGGGAHGRAGRRRGLRGLGEHPGGRVGVPVRGHGRPRGPRRHRGKQPGHPTATPPPIQLLAQERIAAHDLVTHQFPFEKIHDAFDVVLNRASVPAPARAAREPADALRGPPGSGAPLLAMRSVSKSLFDKRREGG